MGSIEYGKLTALEKFLVVAYFPAIGAVLFWFGLHLENSWGILVLLLEGLLAAVIAANTWVAWRLIRPVPPPRSTANRTVDFFITTFDESDRILRRTIRQTLKVADCKAIWILDDGNRPSIRRLCSQYKVNYIRRTSRENAKAGNLNHALPMSRADLIAVFDADGFPARDFLEGTVDLFDDPEVAIVQVNQICYFPDAFQFAPRYALYRMWHEQSFFYDLILPGKQSRRAASWCGNGALIRRQALDAIGGVTTGSIAEDLETTYRLCSEGWKVEYVDLPKAFNLAPAGVDGYIRQRNRWEMGYFSLLRTEGPGLLRSKCLTLSQKITHIMNPLNYYLESIPRFLCLFIPLFLVTAEGPVFDVSPWALVLIWGLVQWRCWLYLTVSRGKGTNSYTGAFWIVKGPLYFFNLLRAPFYNRTPFKVTNKEAKTQKKRWSVVVLAMSTVAFVSWGLALQALVLRPHFDTYVALILATFLSGCSIGALRLVYRSRLACVTNGHFVKLPVRFEATTGQVLKGFTRFLSPERVDAYFVRAPGNSVRGKLLVDLGDQEIEIRAKPLETGVRFQDECPIFWVQFGEVNMASWDVVEDFLFSKTPAEHLCIESEEAVEQLELISGDESSLSSQVFWGSGFRSLVRILERAKVISRRMIMRRA